MTAPTTTHAIVHFTVLTVSMMCFLSDATIAEESQRMLDQVNARMEAQRRERGGVLGSWRNSGISPADQDGGNAGAACAIDQSEMKKLAEKHGIVVRFVDDDAASGVAQVRALARAHGIRIQILGQENGEEKEEMPFVVDEAGGGDTATPPPVLSSLRTSATPASRSLSPAPQTSMKVIVMTMAIPPLLAWRPRACRTSAREYCNISAPPSAFGICEGQEVLLSTLLLVFGAFGPAALSRPCEVKSFWTCVWALCQSNPLLMNRKCRFAPSSRQHALCVAHTSFRTARFSLTASARVPIVRGFCGIFCFCALVFSLVFSKHPTCQ